MIPFNFTYCRPSTAEDAVNAFNNNKLQNQMPFYYAGGSEIITMCRLGSIKPHCVIDVKDISECKAISLDNCALHIGAACTLNEISCANLFPLLKLVCGRIADHTNQCRITLGGNICGTIIYRETALPLLLSDAAVTVFGPDGTRSILFGNIFKGRISLAPGEFILNFHIPIWALSAKHAHIKKTTNEKIDYPLISICAIEKNNNLCVAFSGACCYPFRSG